MSRFNEDTATNNNNSNSKPRSTKNTAMATAIYARPKRYAAAPAPLLPNKRRVTKAETMTPSTFVFDTARGEQLLAQSTQNRSTVSVLNSQSTPPPTSFNPPVGASTAGAAALASDPSLRKNSSVTPQPSYVISDTFRSPYGTFPSAVATVNDQVSSSRVVNSAGVSPNRIPTQDNSPLGNTIYSTMSPTISPEQLIAQQLAAVQPVGSALESTVSPGAPEIPQFQPQQAQDTRGAGAGAAMLNNEGSPIQDVNMDNNNNYASAPQDTDNNGQRPNGSSYPNDTNPNNNNNNPNNNSSGRDNLPQDSNDDNNNSNNSNNNNGVNRKSGQALVQKLQDIYKLIVKQEIELQDRCSQLTTSQTTDLKNLWTIYKINIDLINNYTTFITTALLPSQSPQDIQIGEEIIEIYRIERRLWVYGTITFLDVLKNFSNFMDPDVCSQFITHVFISLSTMLIDIPPKHSIPWLQRLGDLSRMAIALYPSGFIDWKLSAEYWYLEAMKFTYGHGKLYYHMSTVQQNTLEAFVNLGKSVFCQDTFTPSQQYMQLVIDNIYQRTFVDRTNNGNIRNSDLIDYLKHSEVMLLPTFLENVELQRVVLNYFQDRFGIDYNENNIFLTRQMFTQIPSSLRFFFRHAPAFAESHILQVLGFGDPKNPFAILFDLPKYLKERKDKKDKNKSKNADSNPDTETGSNAPPSIPTTTGGSPQPGDPLVEDFGSGLSLDTVSVRLATQEYFDNIESLKAPIKKADIYIWIRSLDYINLTSLKCSMIVLKKFLHGPFMIALPHLIPWLYFVVAISKKVRDTYEDDEDSVKFWRILAKRLLPWNTITSFLNVLMAYTLDNYDTTPEIDEMCKKYDTFDDMDSLVEYFNQNEELPEVWKCWGTLWYDVIGDKGSLKADNFKDLGIKDHMFLDLPIDGIDFDPADEMGAKFWKRALRVIFLFKGIASEFDIGLDISHDTSVHCRNEKVPTDHVLRSFAFKRGPYTESTSERFNEVFPLSENPSAINADFSAQPSLSVIDGESIFDYPGYKKLYPNGESFDKNGDVISSSLYTAYNVSTGGSSVAATSSTTSTSNMGADVNVPNLSQNDLSKTASGSTAVMQQPQAQTPQQQQQPQQQMYPGVFDNVNVFADEETWFTKYMYGRNTFTDMPSLAQPFTPGSTDQLTDVISKGDTHFVFDATSWLRHFAHIYKLATNGVLRFAVCLTTFQELRFLRKSKDENVVEAAARAIITMRQLYREGKLLPLRFTGNIAADIEEHLEVEEQITWRSHVDEFVIEAVMKAQGKFCESQAAKGVTRPFSYVVLVTDDATMARKAKDQGVMTFSTHFVFSLCTRMGVEQNVCTN